MEHKRFFEAEIAFVYDVAADIVYKLDLDKLVRTATRGNVAVLKGGRKGQYLFQSSCCIA